MQRKYSVKPPGQRPPRKTRRGGATPTYSSWANMIRRCTNPDDPHYESWGGRGITVCERWLDFDNFYADMGEKPEGRTLERRDNDGPYERANCYWATWAEQARNKRSAKLTREKILEIQRLRKEISGVGRLAEAVELERHLVGVVCSVLAVVEDG